ncbi:MAG: adenylyl-sulfate kinase [Gemmatimonadaceae bacterium]|nr:adenylyl-sulfate kinase [Gemmatimonadaceae bacterium]
MSAGATLWFTGLPSSGKSTIAREVEAILLRRNLSVELLDGPEVRQSLSRGLGFSRDDREENLRRIGYVAKLLSRNGVIAICASVSPYRATRNEIRERVTNFIEIFVDVSLAVAERRDSEGLYARARNGAIEEFTGVTAPYEPPESPEVHIQSDRESVESAAGKVVKTLELIGIIPVAEGHDRLNVADEDEVRRRLAGLGYI